MAVRNPSINALNILGSNISVCFIFICVNNYFYSLIYLSVIYRGSATILCKLQRLYSFIFLLSLLLVINILLNFILIEMPPKATKQRRIPKWFAKCPTNDDKLLFKKALARYIIYNCEDGEYPTASVDTYKKILPEIT